MFLLAKKDESLVNIKMKLSCVLLENSFGKIFLPQFL